MKTIGIIGAMPSELVDIQTALSDATVTEKAGFSYHVCNRADVRIVTVCSGIAKTNAALCAQVLIDTFQPDAILNAGIAGGMHPNVHVCDVVVSNEVLYHDLNLHFLQDYPPYCGIFPASEKLIHLAVDTCRQLEISSYIGRIISGEAFISDNAVKAELQRQFSPYAVDMESAAVGHCAYRNQVPFVSIRCISDNADDEGAMSFDQFEKIAAKRVADILLCMIESMQEQPA